MALRTDNIGLLFINGTHETFTPTHSGALATVIWESCRVGRARGRSPRVISIRGAHGRPFEWERLTLIDYPWPPANRWLRLPARVGRKLGGYRHLGHAAYCRRVARAIRAGGFERLPMVLFNDPELAVHLRDRFPGAFIAHWFQNSHDCTERFRRRFATAVDRVLAVSDFTGRWVSEFYGFPAGRVHTVYNATDADHFAPAPSPPPGKPVISFVGRTHPVKGPDLLLEAALRLTEHTREFAVQIIGSNYFETFVMDDYQAKLRAQADALRARGVEVRTPGHVGRAGLPDELRRAHVHVVPARWDEPFGMTSLEGMACGLATVAARTGGTPEVVGDAALLFDREDVDQLARHLGRLVADAELRSEYARRARARAARFTWAQTWDALTASLGCGVASVEAAPRAAGDRAAVPTVGGVAV